MLITLAEYVAHDNDGHVMAMNHFWITTLYANDNICQIHNYILGIVLFLDMFHVMKMNNP